MRLFKPLLAIGLCLTIPLTVLAHSGGTDSSGGHYDHDTGEYHYHHGYSAHQHSDKDGDGILDCPYRTNGKQETAKKKSSSTKESKTFWDHVWDVLVFLWEMLCTFLVYIFYLLCFVFVCEIIAWIFKKIFKR